MEEELLREAFKLGQQWVKDINDEKEPVSFTEWFNKRKEAINYTRCSTQLKGIIPISFEDWLKENCEKLHGAFYRYKGNVLDRYDMRYVYMREVKQCF